MTAEDLGSWQPYPVQELTGLLREATFTWWVAGGWALDLFIGRQTRQHEDLDIEVFRQDQHAIQKALPGWDIQVASGGTLRPLRADEWLLPGNNSLWCRSASDAPWALQIMLAECDGTDWVYRRNHAVRRSVSEIGLKTGDGLPFLVPEIQLLFKAKEPRPKDEADFEVVLPKLDADGRKWLANALALAHPSHPWLQCL